MDCVVAVPQKRNWSSKLNNRSKAIIMLIKLLYSTFVWNFSYCLGINKISSLFQMKWRWKTPPTKILFHMDGNSFELQNNPVEWILFALLYNPIYNSIIISIRRPPCGKLTVGKFTISYSNSSSCLVSSR